MPSRPMVTRWQRRLAAATAAARRATAAAGGASAAPARPATASARPSPSGKPPSTAWSHAGAVGGERLVGLVAAGDPRVEVPAQVVEVEPAQGVVHEGGGGVAGGERLEDPAARAGGPAGHLGPHGGGGGEQVLLGQEQEADHDVGDLDAGVVDVVLDLDLGAGGAQAADQGVAQHGVAQVADVGGLVGVDVGVLDDDLGPRGGPGRGAGPEQVREERAAAQAEVEEPRSLDAGHGLQERQRVVAGRGGDACGDGSGDLLGDGAGGTAQRLGQRQRAGPRQVAELAARRHLQRHRHLTGAHLRQRLAHGGAQRAADLLEHRPSLASPSHHAPATACGRVGFYNPRRGRV